MFCIYQAMSLTRSRDILNATVSDFLWWSDHFIADSSVGGSCDYRFRVPRLQSWYFNHYFSHLITCSAVNSPWNWHVHSCQWKDPGLMIIKGNDHIKGKNMMVILFRLLVALLCPKIFIQHILLDYLIFITTSGFKWCSFISIKKIPKFLFWNALSNLSASLLAKDLFLEERMTCQVSIHC